MRKCREWQFATCLKRVHHTFHVFPVPVPHQSALRARARRLRDGEPKSLPQGFVQILDPAGGDAGGAVRREPRRRYYHRSPHDQYPRDHPREQRHQYHRDQPSMGIICLVADEQSVTHFHAYFILFVLFLTAILYSAR